MRAPKGFGRRYFTLSAIQAYSGSIALQRCASSTTAHHRRVSDECDDAEAVEEEDLPTLEALRAVPPGSRRRPCHCNLHFHRLACRRLRSHDRARHSVSPYRYIRSTLSPPLMTLFNTHQTIHTIKGNP